MGKRRLNGFVAGTAATGGREVEVNATLGLEIDGATTRVTLAPAGAPERAQVREVRDPAVARWAAAVQAELEQTARAEAYRTSPCTPNWKPKRERRASAISVVCPDCEGAGAMAGAECMACGGQGWRKV